MNVIKKNITLPDGRVIEIETGKLAKQAAGSAVVKMGGTMLLATVTVADEVKEGTDFLPLSVDYREKYYSAGRFPGGFLKRESKPSDYEVLIARLVDRPIRPLWPADFHNEIFVYVNLISAEKDVQPDALAGFADVPGTRIAVFYPKNGVSPIQEKQMVTEKGANTFVAGITGNFDDAQTGVKKMFSDKKLAELLDEKGFQFSSANSINIGRLVPQIVYYVYSYTRLIASGKIKAGDKINVVVPTGNFGNILAAYYASLMGMPVDRFICASNDNKVLYDFFTTGTYDRNREFILTSSPSMDILISSNLERLIYRIAGNSAEDNAEFMKQLSETGRYKITDQMKKNLFHFYGNFATSDEVAETIRKVYEEDGYIIDTHTAVAVNVYDKFKEETGDKDTPTLIASTASPYKFTRSVMTAIDPAYDAKGDFELVDELARLSAVTIPQAIEDIRSAEVLHKTVCDKEDMEKVVKGFLGI